MKKLIIISLLSLSTTVFGATFQCISMSDIDGANAGVAELKGYFNGPNLLTATDIMMTDLRIPGYPDLTGVRIKMSSEAQFSRGDVRLRTINLPKMMNLTDDEESVNRISLEVSKFSSPAVKSAYVLWYHGEITGYHAGTFSGGQLYMQCEISK